MEKKNLDKNILLYITFIGLIMLIMLNLDAFLSILKNSFGLLSPISIGCIIAFILNIVVSAFEKIYFKNTKNKWILKTKKIACLLLSLAAIAFVLNIVSKLILPQVRESISIFVDRFPHLYSIAYDQISSLGQYIPSIEKQLASSNIQPQEIIQKIVSFMSSWTGGIISVLNSFLGVVTNLVLGLIIAIYIVLGRENLKRQFNKLFTKVISRVRLRKIYYVLDITNSTFRAFFIGQFIEAIILGSLCFIGMSIFKFPYASMISSFIGITALIPMIGAYLGGFFGFLMILTKNPMMAIFFVVFLVILQQLEGNLIYPRVVGTSIGLPGLWVLIAIIIGGGVFGPVGILLGVPVFATIYKLLKNFVNDVDEYSI